MKINAPVGYFEVYKYFARYGRGAMLCHYDGRVLNYVQFASGRRRIVIDKILYDLYKKEIFSTPSEQQGE